MTTKKIREQKLAEVAVEDVVTEDVEQFDTSEALANLLEQSEQEFINTLDALREPIDPKLIKSREGWRDREGNKHYVDYVEWHTVADILDRVCPFWTHEVKELKAFSEIMTCTVKLTINGVTREGVGSGDANNEKGIKKAEHDALKRAAVKFGVARDLYRKEASLEELEGAAPEYGSRYNQDVPADPVAKTISDLVTARQLGMIKAVCREMGIDPFEECEAAMHCSLDELSKRGASSFITYLQTPGARTPQEAVQAQGQAQGARPAPTRTFSARGNTPNGAPTITAVPKPTGLAVANKPSVNKLKIWIHDLGLTESEIALQYSGERTNDVSFLTQEECDRARANLSKM